MVEQPQTPKGGVFSKLAEWVKKNDWVYWVLAIFGIIGLIAVVWYWLTEARQIAKISKGAKAQ
jgi:uncharacterized membrane protein YcjF (UPF0283 family)